MAPATAAKRAMHKIVKMDSHPFLSYVSAWKSFLPWTFLALAVIWMGILIWKWPFTRKAVTTSLQHEFQRTVRFGAFHPTFFPLGYVADDVRLVNEGSENDQATITARRLVITAHYSDLLLMRKRVKLISVAGLRVTIPNTPPASRAKTPPTHQASPRFSEIGHIKLEDAAVEFKAPGSDLDPFKIVMKRVVFDHVTRNDPASFQAELLTNELQSTIYSSGQVGPWNWNDAGRTALSGSFQFKKADLGTLGGVEGGFNATGKFSGPLSQVACSGTINVPQFGTSAGSHTLPLLTTFRATVNGLNGDTTLDHVESRLNHTVIQSQGTVKEDSQHAGKTTSLRMSVDEGQIADLLLLFTRSWQPSMTGTISLQANAELPPGPTGFLRKLKLQGDFGMSGSRFTKTSTQVPIDDLSKSAGGMSKKEQEEDNRTVLSDVKGHVVTQDGIARLSRVSFTVPGATAELSGTYNLLNKAVRLQGTLRTTGKISDATSGLKAGAMKVLTPFLKKRSVTVVPFTLTGTVQHVTFALDLTKKKRF